MRRYVFAAAGFGALAAVQLFALARLPYSRCLVFPADPSQVDVSPTAAGFHIGSVEWPVQQYASDTALQPFREEFRRHCAGTDGTTAALCVSKAMSDQFAFGSPKRDFFAREFEPAASLASHLRGEPGDCVTRSGMLVTELLSVGIPARVVQLVPAKGPGHNIVEIWDAKTGWTLLDPSLRALVGTGGEPTSAAKALTRTGSLQLVSEPFPAPGLYVIPYSVYRLPDTNLVYPEPWLYLRTGPRSAPWPFHGRFGQIGGLELRIGRTQTLLRFGIGGTALMVAALMLAGIFRRRSRAEASERPAVAPTRDIAAMERS